MWIYTNSVRDEYGSLQTIAVGPSKKTLLDYAIKHIIQSEPDAKGMSAKDFKLKWRACEDGEYAIEDKNEGMIFGWLTSGIKLVKA